MPVNDGMTSMYERLEKRVATLENRVSEHDTQYAVINTKLSAILWVLGTIGVAVIGVLIKFVFNV